MKRRRRSVRSASDYDSPQNRPRTHWFQSNQCSPSARRQLSFCACISSRITTGIHVVRDFQINYDWYNEPFAVSPYKSLYLDMHGLIFETSVWLLAESTRLPTWTSHGPPALQLPTMESLRRRAVRRLQAVRGSSPPRHRKSLILINLSFLG